jgi:outer membrane usher protein
VNLRGQGASDVFGDVGLSARGALFSSTTSYTGERGLVRGLTRAIVDQRSSLRRLTAGDAIVSNGLLGGSLVLGGITVGRDYSVDPYFARSPTLDLLGTVSTPSTVDVLVDGRLVSTQALPPGPFRLDGIPTTSGANNTRLVIRDAFGGVREVSESYYLSTGALARGLEDYQVSAGLERRSLGVKSWSYGTPVVMARYRRGLTNALTVGGRIEATPALVSTGPSITANALVGELEAAISVSRTETRQGYAFSAAFLRTSRQVNGALSVRAMSPSYATTSLRPDDDRPMLDVAASLGVSLGRGRSATVRRHIVSMSGSGRVVRTSVTVSTPVSGRADLSVGATVRRDATGAAHEALVGVTIRMGKGATAGVSAGGTERGTHAAVDVNRPLPVGAGWGYQLHNEPGEGGLSQAVLQYQGPYGRYELRPGLSAGATSLSASGSVVAVGGGLYASRPIQDGFALVRVPGVAGVRATSSHQVVGRTNRHGSLLVPNLLPYYGNVLGISDVDVPLANTVTSVSKTVAPPYRGGAVVTFPSRPVQSVAGILVVNDQGVPRVPAYGQLTVQVGDETRDSPIGESGEFYVEGVPPGRHPAFVEQGGHTYAFVLDVPVSGKAHVNLGRVSCGDRP